MTRHRLSCQSYFPVHSISFLWFRWLLYKPTSLPQVVPFRVPSISTDFSAVRAWLFLTFAPVIKRKRANNQRIGSFHHIVQVQVILSGFRLIFERHIYLSKMFLLKKRIELTRLDTVHGPCKEGLQLDKFWSAGKRRSNTNHFGDYIILGRFPLFNGRI